MIQLVIDHDAHAIHLNGAEVQVKSDRHYELITYLAMNTKRAIGALHLIAKVYGPNVHVSIEDLVNDIRMAFEQAIEHGGLIIIEAIEKENLIIIDAIGSDGLKEFTTSTRKYSLNTEGVHVTIIDDQNGEVVPLPTNGTSNTEQPRRPIFRKPAEKKDSRPREEISFTERDEVGRRKNDRPTMS